MLQETKTLEIEDKKIVIKEMTVDFIDGLNKGHYANDLITLLGEFSDLSEEDIRGLGIKAAEKIAQQINTLTFGEVDDKGK